MSEYTFNTRTAKHTFCRICGVVPFYRPRSNPDGYAVTVHCLDPGTVEAIEVKYFDGENWEQFVEGSVSDQPRVRVWSSSGQFVEGSVMSLTCALLCLASGYQTAFEGKGPT